MSRPWTDAEFERMKDADKEAFERLTKAENELLQANKLIAELALAIKDNEIRDITGNRELMDKLNEVARSGGKKSGGRSGKVWGIIAGGGLSGLFQAIEALF